MSNNIQELLNRLPQDSLAYQLVSLLRDQPREKWEEILKDYLHQRISQEIQRRSHDQDQTPGD